MYCKNCGAAMNDNQAICLQCGVKTGDGNQFCPNCGQPVAPGAAVCMSCGVSLYPVQNAYNNYLNGQDKIAMALLCIYLGVFGVHNFVMGETKKGILKIVTTFCFGFGAILALVDFVKILSGKYIIDPDAFI